MKMTIPITTTYTILIIERGKLRLAFVSTKAVLVRKRRRTFGVHKPKAPLCRREGGKPPMNLPAAKFTLSPKVTEGLFYNKILSCYNPSVTASRANSLANFLPFTQGKLITARQYT